MTAVGDIIQPGQSIPPDVTEVKGPQGLTLPIRPGDTAIARLTVTAVREQPAEPELDVLYLVRQYGDKRSWSMATVLDENQDGDAVRERNEEARQILARIEAEVQRLRAELADTRQGEKRMMENRDELLVALGDARNQRDDYAARLKATDASWAAVAAERDDARRARDFLTEQVVKPAREALDAVGIDGGVKLADRILLLANERDEARSKATHLAVELAATQQMLDVATAEPDPSAPLVLSLPTLPHGATLSGNARWVRSERDPAKWVIDDEAPVRMILCTCEVVAREGGSVTVVMREPRTWAPVEIPERDDLPAVVEVDGHGRWRMESDRALYYCPGRGNGFPFERLLVLGEVHEVFDEDGADR